LVILNNYYQVYIHNKLNITNYHPTIYNIQYTIYNKSNKYKSYLK
jgi:hypothetical protein